MSITRVVRDRLGRRDSYQEQRQALALLIAVGHKFFEDRSINLASMVAFWAFFR